MERIKLYGKYERYWHWSQFGAIATLTITGFEIHSTYEFFGYERAVNIHNIAGWGYAVLLIFTYFWMFFSGMYKQFLPTRERFMEQLHYYTIGIMRNEPHPVHKTPDNKLNPIQRLTYFGLMWVLLPLQVLTGLMYLYIKVVKELFGIQSVEWIALSHTLMAFMVIAFLIVHLYMITTGKTLTTYLEGMITGKEKTEINSI
ncbi:MAG: cytochrome b/b6 domain-containing protein [Prolixibacteraceae bacterium]|nr:cytochrome b/b6 domain-containing protein [Prolixibacteraceae bacterium]